MTISAKNFKPLPKNVLVSQLGEGTRKTSAGIIILDDDMKDRGIRDRWARVEFIGDGIDDLSVGEWVLIKHGRWTNGIDFETDDGSRMKLWKIDYPDAVMLVSKEDLRNTSSL